MSQSKRFFKLYYFNINEKSINTVITCYDLNYYWRRDNTSLSPEIAFTPSNRFPLNVCTTTIMLKLGVVLERWLLYFSQSRKCGECTYTNFILHSGWSCLKKKICSSNVRCSHWRLQAPFPRDLILKRLFGHLVPYVASW